jgi:hypothetical protein
MAAKVWLEGVKRDTIESGIELRCRKLQNVKE